MENIDEPQQRINECYTISLRGIEAFLGLELSIIEKARLREMVRCNVEKSIRLEEMYDENENMNAFCAAFNPQTETIHVFLHDYYGIPHLSPGWRELFDKEAYEMANPDVWRRIQEDSHKP